MAELLSSQRFFSSYPCDTFSLHIHSRYCGNEPIPEFNELVPAVTLWINPSPAGHFHFLFPGVDENYATMKMIFIKVVIVILTYLSLLMSMVP